MLRGSLSLDILPQQIQVRIDDRRQDRLQLRVQQLRLSLEGLNLIAQAMSGMSVTAGQWRRCSYKMDDVCEMTRLDVLVGAFVDSASLVCFPEQLGQILLEVR